MPFCMQCGNRISDLAVDCPKCGTPNVRYQGAPRASAVPHREFANAPLLRPLGVGEIVDAALKVYRSNVGTLLKAVAIVVFPVQIVSALIQTSVVPDPDVLIQPPLQPQPGFEQAPPQVNFGPLWTMLAGFVLTFVLNGLASQLATATSMRAVSEAYLGEKPKWSESLEFALTKFGSLLWLGFLTLLGTGLGYMLCIVPGIWLSIMWSVAVPALLVEDLRGTGAMSRSFQLVKSRFWPVVGVLVLANLVAFVVNLIFGFATGFIAFLGESPTVQFVSQALSNSISLTITTPFIAAAIAILYFDLRVRKEGFDLELLAQHVGGEAVPANARAFGPPPGPGGAPGGAGPAAPPPPYQPGPSAPYQQEPSQQGPAGYPEAPPPPPPPPPSPPRRRPVKPGYTPPPEDVSDEGNEPSADR